MNQIKLLLLVHFQLLLFVSIVNGFDEWNYPEDFYNEIEDDSNGNFGNRLGLNGTNFKHLKRQKRKAPAKSRNAELAKGIEALGHSPYSWVEEAWDMHVKLRKLHGIDEELILDYALVEKAQDWAIELGKRAFQAQKVVLEHESPFMYSQGETLGGRKLGTREQLQSLPGSFPVRIWYAEIEKHDWKNNYWQWDSGHFSQIVWSSTKAVGCARYISESTSDSCNNGIWEKRPILTMVCRYDPPGNWLNKAAFNSHVKPPLSGEPNKEPDFKLYCPEGAEGCDRPHVCCTAKSKPVDFINPCFSKGRSLKTNGTAKAKGRSAAKPTTKKPASKTTSKPKKNKIKVKALIQDDEEK